MTDLRSRTSVLALLLTAVALPLHAQTGNEPTAAPQTGPVPRLVVSDMIQSALDKPGGPEASGATDLSGPVRPAGVAGSPTSIEPPRNGPLAAAGRFLKGLGVGVVRLIAGSARALNGAGVNGLLVGGFLVTGVGVLIVLRRVSPPRGAARDAAVGEEESQRLWKAQTLVTDGLPPSEIAVRTGLSRDTLNLLSRIAPASREAALPSSVPPSQPSLEAAIPARPRTPVDYTIPGVRPSPKPTSTGRGARANTRRGNP